MMKFAIRFTATVALFALMTVIAEAKPQPSTPQTDTQQLSSVVRMHNLKMPDGGRAANRPHSQCSHAFHLNRIDARGDPDAVDIRFNFS